MATLSAQGVTTAGVAATYSPATATTGDRVPTGDNVVLHVKNGGGSPTIVTLTTPGKVDGLDIADRTVSVPASSDRFITLPDKLYRAGDGLATVVCNPVTSVTVAVIRL